MLLFRIQSIEKGLPITAADGEWYDSKNVLVARKGSVRRPSRRDPAYLNVNRIALGAFAYFDGETHERVIYDLDSIGRGDQESHVPKKRTFPSYHLPFFSNNIEKTLKQPERRLILDYVNWVGDVEMFADHPLKESGLFTDLFIPRCWTLIEAKASLQRRALRESIGQLFDYQRFYTRSPRLAVLLPERPQKTLSDLFTKKRIVVIWQCPGGSFRDSSYGVLTTDLRAL